MVKIELNIKYRLLNFLTGTYMTLLDDGSVVGLEYTHGPSQLWVFFQGTATDTYFIESAENTPEPGYIGPANNSVVQGAPLRVYDTQFEFKAVDEPNTAVAARFVPSSNTNLYIDLFGGSPAPGTIVQLWPKSGNNQVWILERFD